MTCEECGGDVLLDHVQGRLRGQEREAVERHLAACAPCRAASDDLRALSQLSGAPALEPSAATDQAIREVILGAAAAPKPATRRRWLRRSATAPSAARYFWIAAAAALFVCALLYSLASTPPTAPSRPVAVTDPPTAAPPPKPLVAPQPPADAKPGPAVLPEPPRPPAPRPPDLPTPPAPRPEPPKPPPPTPTPPKPPAPAETVVAAAAPEFGRVLKLTARSEMAGAPLAKGDRIFSGDSVACRTGSLLIEMQDKSVIALRAGTVAAPTLKGDDVSVRLTEGEVACSVTPRASGRFAVDTPQGTVTVKGTIFSVRLAGSSAIVTVAKGKVEARSEAGPVDLSAGERSTMSRNSAPTKPEALNPDRALAWVEEAGIAVPGPIWIAAGGPTAEFHAPMTKGRRYAEQSLTGEPVFANVDSRTLPSWEGRFLRADGTEGGWVAYAVDLPEAGTWYLWGRLYYPGPGNRLFRDDVEPRENDPNSFYVSVDGGPEKVFGNLRQDPETKALWYRRWHWGGEGAVELGKPAPLALGTLAKGRHTLRIRNRDAVETGGIPLAPRLDALCLTTLRDYRPRDEDFRK